MWPKLPTHVKGVPIRWVLFALVTLAVILWLRFAPAEAPWSPRRILGSLLTEPKEVVRIERVDVPGPERIRTIVKEKIVERYKTLPIAATVSDNASVVTAVAEVPPSPEGGVAVAVLRTGQDNVAVGSIEYQPKPAPFFAIKREMGVRGGIGTGGYLAGEFYVRPVRIGPIETEARAYVHRSDADGSDFGAAVFVDFRF